MILFSISMMAISANCDPLLFCYSHIMPDHRQTIRDSFSVLPSCHDWLLEESRMCFTKDPNDFTTMWIHLVINIMEKMPNGSWMV